MMNHESVETRTLPRYKCHKEVHALKISRVERNDLGALLHFEDDGHGPTQVPERIVALIDSNGGGYYVVYRDGYTSWSPAKAFEEGYTKI